ncbi:hypothetical protein X975_01830, partial [Stegodyphus mimosarum]
MAFSLTIYHPPLQGSWRHFDALILLIFWFVTIPIHKVDWTFIGPLKST